MHADSNSTTISYRFPSTQRLFLPLTGHAPSISDHSAGSPATIRQQFPPIEDRFYAIRDTFLQHPRRSQAIFRPFAQHFPATSDLFPGISRRFPDLIHTRKPSERESLSDQLKTISHHRLVVSGHFPAISDHFKSFRDHFPTSS